MALGLAIPFPCPSDDFTLSQLPHAVDCFEAQTSSGIVSQLRSQIHFELAACSVIDSDQSRELNPAATAHTVNLSGTRCALSTALVPAAIAKRSPLSIAPDLPRIFA